MDELEPPRLILRLHSDAELADGHDLAGVLAESDPDRWRRLVDLYGEIAVRPVFTAVEPGRLRELQAVAARRDPTYRPEPLHAFGRVEAHEGTDLAALAKVLRGWEVVRSVEIEEIGPDPLVNDGDDPRASNQDYLDPAPTGIDARYAWTFPGGDGAGQRIVDLERGWTFDHEDLTAHGITLLHGTIRDLSRGHGTAVFGEMIAVDNTVGCVGIAPNVASAMATSFHSSSIPNAVVAAIDAMEFGDVLLLEVQANVSTSATAQYGPAETVEANWEAIRLATALGMIVVEAGGNGTANGSAPAVNLDTWTNADGERILWRHPSNADFRDSGAIIVAAASSAAPHTRLAYSTFGARIDCFGWGHNINTLDSDESADQDAYTTGFGGTSGASPIVAGAALCLQGICQANQRFRLSPRQMRTMLSDPVHNTPRSPAETTAIGMMPNLRNLIDIQLGLTPDVYVRDNTADTGDSSMGAISASPDVILRPAQVANPQAAYGAGSGTEANASLGFEAEAGQDNFIYVRALNQGTTGAAGTTATVFWSPVSTLVTPNLWTLVGSVVIPSIPPGEVLTVSDAITWPAAQIPGPGHYCLVAILNTAGDPGPDPTDFVNFDNFRAFIRENNNVTWRNFNVVDTEPDPASDPSGYVSLPFVVAGAPDKARRFTIDLTQRVPWDADVRLEVPLELVRAFQADLDIIAVDDQRGVATAQLQAPGRVRFGPGLIDAGAVHQLRLLVRFADPANTRARIVARQLIDEDEEVGRVTWTLAPGVRERFAAAQGGDPIGALG